MARLGRQPHILQRNGGAPTTTIYNIANQISTTGYTYDAVDNLLHAGTAASTSADIVTRQL